ELEKLNGEKDRFFSIIAHDLRNPFRGIYSLSEILAEDWRNLSPEELDSSLKEMHKGSEQLNRLLENLLSWAQLQKGRLSIEPKPWEVEKLLEGCLMLFQGMADQKRIRLELSIESGTVVVADEEALATVVRNLINNAIKYSPEGGEIRVRAERRGKEIAIEVKDFGVGMDEKKVNSLLVLGEHKSTPGTSGEQGSGLGLQLCKEWVHLQGGRLEVKSALGQGSCFTVFLPAS
ncbi:MAG: sensor histidine kinase, partial [Verrucomicrobiales bacterium]